MISRFETHTSEVLPYTRYMKELLSAEMADLATLHLHKTKSTVFFTLKTPFYRKRLMSSWTLFLWITMYWLFTGILFIAYTSSPYVFPCSVLLYDQTTALVCPHSGWFPRHLLAIELWGSYYSCSVLASRTCQVLSPQLSSFFYHLEGSNWVFEPLLLSFLEELVMLIFLLATSKMTLCLWLMMCYTTDCSISTNTYHGLRRPLSLILVARRVSLSMIVCLFLSWWYSSSSVSLFCQL